MEADLQRFYQLDLTDHYRGLLSFRRLLVLFKHVPPEAHTRQLPGNHHTWNADDVPYLLGDVYAALAGEHHPGHPVLTAERRARLEALKERSAHYQQRG